MSKKQENCRCANSYYTSKPQLKLQAETTNQATYKPHPIQKPLDLPPPTITQKHYDADCLRTSYNDTFTKYNLPQTESHQNQVNVNRYFANKPKNIPFQSATSYKESYPRHEVKAEKQPVYEYKPVRAKFEGESSYRNQFVPKKNADLQGRGQQLATVKDYMDRKVRVPFQGKTSYKDTFTQHSVKVEKQPEYRYQPNKNKFQGSSSYKDTFKQFPKEIYNSGMDYCPVHPDKVAIK